MISQNAAQTTIMTRVVLLLAAALCCVGLGSGCSPDASSLSDNQTSFSNEVRYSLEVYYQMLLFIKENNLLKLEDCPRCRCFSDGTCVDLCDSGVWP